MQGGGATADHRASHKLVEIKSFLYLHVLQERERCPRGNLSSAPLSFPVLWERLRRGRAEPCRRGGWEIPAPAQPALTQPGQWPCTANKEEGRVGERKGGRGGERRGRQGNRGLNLDTNLNRYCPSQSAGLVAQQATSSASPPNLGTPRVHFLSLLLSSYFLSPFLSSPPTPLFSLYFSPLLAFPGVSASISAVHTSLLQAAGSLACLFVRRESLSF